MASFSKRDNVLVTILPSQITGQKNSFVIKDSIGLDVLLLNCTNHLLFVLTF